MAILKLDDGLSLFIEQNNKKIRLVITDGTTELACRKETPTKLYRFLSSTEKVTLFKGRLQLNNTGDEIAVVLKGNITGYVSVPNLKNALSTL